MKNKYEKLFDEFLDLIEFTLIKHKDYWSLVDRQEGNLGNIEQDRFENAMEIIDRMDIYIQDYIARPLQEALNEMDETKEGEYSDDFEEIVNTCYNHYPSLNAWDVDVLDMICYHSKEIDLNKCFYEEANRNE